MKRSPWLNFIPFSLIMKISRGSEYKGRNDFLHAISWVADSLPWSEARNFHNVTLRKIEQDVLNWRVDFFQLAREFMERRSFQNLRPRASGSNYNQFSRNNFSSRGNNRNFGRGGNNRSLMLVLCFKWNSGPCSYGADCRRWHACS